MGDVFRWLCVGLTTFAMGAFLLAFLASILASFLVDREEKRLRRQLEHAGRFISWADLEVRFSAGMGTLIVEHRGPKGPIREWWTEDDVIAASPVSLPAALKSPPNAEVPHKQYSKLCATRYVDLEAGSAKATEVPAVVWNSSNKLAEKYPQGKVVTLLAWWEEPLLFLGDVDSVFQNVAECSAPPSGAE